ncbi:MAG: SpoIIE family protein phosphatase [Planctomycetota bacterium]
MPRLIVIRGTHHQFHEVAERTTLGAHPDNDVVLEGDSGISRWHCTLTAKNGKFLVKDRSSRRGVFVNGTRVEQGELTYGDRLRLGDTVVIFGPSARDGDGAEARAARRLINAVILQEVNKELNAPTELGDLLELIMDTAIHLTGAERGFLILVQGDQLEFRVARNIASGEVKSPEFKISNKVIRTVVKTGSPILTSNAQQDLRDMKSIAALELRSLLCVPLRGRNKSKVLGTLYLDSQARDSSFDEEGKDLLVAFSDQAAIAIENARLLRAEREREAMLSELRVASRIQLALLPREDPELPHMEVSGRMKTAQEVGGDYFDYIWGPGAEAARNLYVAIGDVSGKGVPAGLVMVMARSILRSLVARNPRPGDVLREANRLLKQDLKPGMFMSMLLATVDPERGRLLLAGCGHERPLVYRAATGEVERVDLGGLVLGVVSDIGPHLAEARLELEPGDQLFLYTDGVTEAIDAARRPFGVERIEDLLRHHGGQPPQRLLDVVFEALELHAGGATQHDDITMIALRRR